jgi:hypothetical protein
MTPEAQRIAIAEACGWKRVVFGGYWAWHHKDGEGYHPEPPDFLNDLNAMHEAEKGLTGTNAVNYYYSLLDVIGHHDHNDIEVVFATASQRAEAFLKTMGKWTP